jgi:hypothetical protein
VEESSSSAGKVKDSFLPLVQTGYGTSQPPTQCVPGAGCVQVKSLGREGDNSLPTTAEIKKLRIYRQAPTIRLL